MSSNLIEQPSSSENRHLAPHDAHDENQLEWARTQWQFGNWDSLAQMDRESLQYHPDRAKLALMAAAGHAQCGNVEKSRHLFRLAQDWGCPKRLIRQVLIAGVQNSLGRAAAVAGQTQRAQLYFEQSVRTVMPYSNARLLAQARAQEQFGALGLSTLTAVAPLQSLTLLEQARQAEQLARLNVNQIWKCQKTLSLDKAGKALHSYKHLETDKYKDLHFVGDVTIEFWIKMNSWPTDWGYIISKRENDRLNEFCFRLKGSEDGSFHYGTGEKIESPTKWTPRKYIELNEWFHIALVRKLGDYSRIYIDGIIRFERILSIPSKPASTNAPIKIMHSVEGNIAELNITAAAKTSEEIRHGMCLKNETTLNRLNFSNTKKIDFDKDDLPPQNIKTEKLKKANSARSLDYNELLNTIRSNRIVNIVVIGANDGKNNDPIFPFAKANADGCSIILIEPQPDLIPILAENYSFHPRKTIINCAIGKDSKIKLYTINKDYWNELDVPYAKERKWPSYRAPTGVASSNKEHVENWLKKHLKHKDTTTAIKETLVPSKSLLSILEECKFKKNIDVLQVDTEGFDDEAIYACDIETTKPKLIHFESVHLKEGRKSLLYDFLANSGYRVFESSENTFALFNSYYWSL